MSSDAGPPSWTRTGVFLHFESYASLGDVSCHVFSDGKAPEAASNGSALFNSQIELHGTLYKQGKMCYIAANLPPEESTQTSNLPRFIYRKLRAVVPENTAGKYRLRGVSFGSKSVTWSQSQERKEAYDAAKGPMNWHFTDTSCECLKDV